VRGTYFWALGNYSWLNGCPFMGLSTLMFLVAPFEASRISNVRSQEGLAEPSLNRALS
jgi:hypothetical protein